MSSLNNGIYQLDNLPFSSREFHKKFTFISGPLSLFDAEVNPDQGNENPDVERPLTPVEEAIKRPPASFSSFAKLIRPRLTPKDHAIPCLSVNDQQELIGVIMNEINNMWSEMKSIPPDPFLSHQQNIELQRRLAIEIVTIAQGLFVKFLDKAQRLHHRGVFSSSANMSRLKTQLALEANKSFNVLSIRRNLAMDMKNPCDGSTVSSFMKLGGVPDAQRSYKPLVVRQEEEKTKLRLTKEELLQRRMEYEISDLQKQMPSMNVEYYYGMFPEEVLMKTKKTPSSVAETERSECESAPLVGIIEENDYLNEKCISEPYLPFGESLLEELGITEAHLNAGHKGLPRSSSVDKIKESDDQSEAEGRVSTKEPEIGTPDYTNQDLRKLIASRSEGSVYEKIKDENETGALPPLLQALAHHSIKKRDKKQVELIGVDKMDDKCSETGSVIGSTKASSIAVDPGVVDDSITEFTGEEHLQPAIVSLRLPDKSVVRASDVRLSNRVNKSSLVLQKYPTIYNDLTGEIDPPTVKWLDRNLFIGEEIKEVYQEIIRTMNTNHLLFDKDPYVEKCATEVNLSICNASTSLKSKSERIMNSNLHREIPPPWGVDTADDWRNNPKFGGLGREDILQAKIGKDGNTGANSKSYNSWLAWWRSTINYDDYLKYISTQDNDFLSMLYHLYDSDSDSEEEGSLDEIRPDTVQQFLGRERENVLAELKAKKMEYKAGFWNANSVLIGGLGQDPIIEEEELGSALAPGRSERGTLSQASQQSFSSDKKSVVSSTKDSQRLTATSIQTKSEVSKAPTLSFQERLERLWTLLYMPEAQRLDMAIKYSGNDYKHKLGDALSAWEIAASVIIDRENLLTRLEDFERQASDPNRFFERGESSTSLLRIRESKIRDSFDKKLSELDREVKRSATIVKKQFGDEVTFQGRPCLEKLRHDRTEMLYWLQQERRQQSLNREVLRVREVSFSATELPPLSTDTLL